MEAPWTIMFWFQLSLRPEPPGEIGVIASYRGITVFLRVRDHVIGLSNGDYSNLGPKITGLEKEPWICLGLGRDQSNIKLYINGEKVMEIFESKVVYKLEDFKIEIRDTSHIKTIEQDLSEWVERRKSIFKMKKEATDKHIILTVQDQERQIENRVRALEEMIDGVYHGKKYFFKDIVVNLRSLVFFKTKSKSYDPLLLRLATFKKVTLPIYVVPDEGGQVKKFIMSMEKRPHFWGFNFAKFEPRIPCIKMVDLQEFLEKPALLYEGEFISPLELIEKLGSKQSTAHFDQTVPRVIEDLKDTPTVFGYNSLGHFILSMAELVIKVGRFVLSKKYVE